ncbi:MAG: IS1380 family transposase [Bacteroidales bacterium]
MKIQKISNNISPFAGICFANAIFNNCGLSELIDKELGKRKSTLGFLYSDIIRNFANIIFSGGNCAEDIQTHFGKYLKAIPGNNVPSADTILRGIKELATENQVFTSQQEKQYTFNINEKLNRLNIKSLLLTHQLKSGKSYDFDYDNQIISTCKYDAKKNYKHTRGYFPGVASIDDKIVYIENRDGNANVKFEQASTLKRAYELLQEQGISINRSRMDAGSYSKEIIEVVAENSNLFYIRANKCVELFEQILQIDTWQTVEINYKIYQVASIKFTRFFEDKNYRLVIMREEDDDKQLNLFTNDNFIYRAILTNDWDSNEKQVIEYYNQRGKSEKLFDVMNNDFCWKHLPCSFINENSSFLIITALIKNFYNFLVATISKIFSEIKPTTRLKRFIFRFISVAGKWVYTSRQWVLKLYTDRPYECLRI